MPGTSEHKPKCPFFEVRFIELVLVLSDGRMSQSACKWHLSYCLPAEVQASQHTRAVCSHTLKPDDGSHQIYTRRHCVPKDSRAFTKNIDRITTTSFFTVVTYAG